MNDVASHSEYDVKNKESLPEKYICPCCHKILKDPVQLTCGDRICKNDIGDKKKIRCPKCSKWTTTAKIKLDKGFIIEMQALIVICLFCEWSGALKTYEDHLQKLHRQLTCSYCSSTFNTEQLLSEHMKTQCPLVTVNCVLKSYGCNTQVLRRDLSEHYLSKEHQKALYSIIKPYIYQMKNNLTADVVSRTTTMEKCNKNEYEQISETIDVISNGVQALSFDVKHLEDTSTEQTKEFTSQDQQIQTIQKACEESNVNLQAIDINQRLIQQNFLSLKDQIHQHAYVSYDGTFVWKITNVQQRINDARSERHVSFYSPPFYSSPTGYKACVRVYPHGDGNARNTHMSVFFVLMRGLYDSLLDFPFKFKVIFCLYDQSGAGKHLIDSFRPDTRSSSFQQPRSDMNIASGIPRFIPLSTIQHPNSPYLKNDTMFLKVMIDFEDLPKAVLPFVMGLNPGIPVGVRQSLIQAKLQQQLYHKDIR